MERISFLFITLLVCFFIPVTYASTFPRTPIGYWKTIDDVTGKPKSIVRIWETSDKKLAATVVKLFPGSGMNPKLCTACSGDKHNQPIVGMVILSGLKMDQDQWDSGEILDPENGKTYSCTLRLTERGEKLNIHGYIGLPLFGRSQTWERVDLMSDLDRASNMRNEV